MDEQRISLYYQDSRSNKEYHVNLEPKDGGYVVNFAFGRRGSTLQTGTKTHSPVPHEKAKKIFDALVNSKTSKGYTVAESGTPYKGTAAEPRSTGILPQLLNPIEEDEVARFIADDRYVGQEKLDGRRMLLSWSNGGEVVAINRKGLECGLPLPVHGDALDLAKISTGFVIDGEAVGDVLHAFDILSQDGQDVRGKPYGERLKLLESLLPTGRTKNIRAVPTAITRTEKKALLDIVRRANGEGIVFKDKAAKHSPGRPASGGSQLKFKFTATVSCIVARQNSKRSVALEVIDAKGKRVGVGNVTIPANHGVPVVGAVVELRYLYAYPNGGSLYQPVYLGVRDDIEMSACTDSQLKYRPDASGGDDDA